MKRPIYRPPDIDIVALFDAEHMIKWSKDHPTKILYPTLRADYFDLYLETHPSLQYRNWIEDVGKQTALCGDLKRKRGFDGLNKVVEEAAEVVMVDSFQSILGVFRHLLLR